MAYTKPYTIDATAGGDTVKAAIVDKVDKNADQIVADLNTHAALTTGAHSLLSAAQVSTGAFEAIGAVSTHAALTTGAHSLLSAALVSTGYFDTAGLAAAALSSAASLVTNHAALSTSAHSLGSAAFLSTGYFGTAAVVSTGAFDATGLAAAALSSSAALVSTHAALSTSAHSLGSAAFAATSAFVSSAFITTAAFTPVLSFGGATTGITYGTQLGQYYRFGNLVYFYLNITLTSNGEATGAAAVTLPLTAASAYNVLINILVSSGVTVVAPFMGRTVGAAASMQLTDYNAGAIAVMDHTDFTDTANFQLAGWYICA